MNKKDFLKTIKRNLNLSTAKESARNFIGSRLGPAKMNKKAVDYYLKDLPTNVFGPKNTDIVANKITEYVKRGDHRGAREYVLRQLQKYKVQTKGTGAYGWADAKIEKYKRLLNK